GSPPLKRCLKPIPAVQNHAVVRQRRRERSGEESPRNKRASHLLHLPATAASGPSASPLVATRAVHQAAIALGTVLDHGLKLAAECERGVHTATLQQVCDGL